MAAEKGNKYAIGNSGGRPPMYSNSNDLEEKINEYFQHCEGEYETREGERTTTTGKGDKAVSITETYTYQECIRMPEIPSITRLTLWLGFSSKDSLYDYIKKEEFTYPIKRAILVIESEYEQGLWNDRPTGSIFALKNMGWKDKQEVDHTTKGQSINQVVLGSGKKPPEE